MAWRQAVGVRALGGDRDGGALRGAEGQKAHDGASAHGLAAAGHGHVGVEALDGLDELGRGAGVQAPAVDDRQLADQGALGHGERAGSPDRGADPWWLIFPRERARRC